MGDNLNLPQNVDKLTNVDLEKLKLLFNHKESEQERGSLGKFFGSGNSISSNIAGLVICVLLPTAIIYTFIMLFIGQETNDLSVKDFWELIITPLVTLAIGYLFGKVC